MSNIPPFTITNNIISLVAEICEQLGRLSLAFEHQQGLQLRKINQMRTVQGTLAIEGNTLSEEQITAIIEGKKVIAPVREVQEAHNALSAYELLDQWQTHSSNDFLTAHNAMMKGLTEQAGVYRNKPP